MLREEGGERGRKRQTDRHPSERETSTSYLLVCALTGDWTHKPQLGSNALMLTSAPAVWLCHPWRTLCEYQNQNTRRQYLRLKRPQHSVARRSAQKAERARVPTGPAARRWPGSVACGSPQLLDHWPVLSGSRLAACSRAFLNVCRHFFWRDSARSRRQRCLYFCWK